MTRDAIKKLKHGRFVLIPISDETRGHGNVSITRVSGGRNW